MMKTLFPKHPIRTVLVLLLLCIGVLWMRGNSFYPSIDVAKIEKIHTIVRLEPQNTADATQIDLLRTALAQKPVFDWFPSKYQDPQYMGNLATVSQSTLVGQGMLNLFLGEDGRMHGTFAPWDASPETFFLLRNAEIFRPFHESLVKGANP